MKFTWDEDRYSVNYVAEKLNCKPADIIYWGTSGKLKIAGYVNIEKDKVEIYKLGKSFYTYASGIYYICFNMLKHFEFNDKVDFIEANHILPVTTYKDDQKIFFDFSEVLYASKDNSSYKNEDDRIESMSSIYDDCFNCCENPLLDSIDDNDDEIDVLLKEGYHFDIKDDAIVLSNIPDYLDIPDEDINMVASPNGNNYYTIYSKDLLIFHDDLIEFFKKMPPQHHDEITKSGNSQISNSYAAINAERMYYLRIITTLSKVIRGDFVEIAKHPILKGSKAESNLIEELAEWKCIGLSKRTLQKIFSEANKVKEPEVPEKALILAIGAMLEIILGTYHQGKKHLSISSESDLIIMLPTLEPSLSDVDFQSIFAKARESISNA